MDEFKRFREAFSDCLRFVTFRADENLWKRVGLRHFLIGFVTTWLVGIGRNWDFPEAPLFAKLGLPSVVYIFVLALVLFLMAWPVSDERLNYWKILTLVSMTAAPGLVYAIPVEQMLPLHAAQQANLLFLAVVALWRVALAYYVFFKAGENSVFVTTAIILTPVCGVIISLVLTGRAGFVMDIMGGNNRPENSNAGVSDAISLMFCLSWPLLIIGFIIWISAALNNAQRD